METYLDEGAGYFFGKKSILRRGNAVSRGHIGSRVVPTEQKNGINQHQQLPVNLSDLLKYYPTCPPDAFINIKEFYQNPALNRLDENDKKVKVTLRNWCSTIRDCRDIFDFNTYYHTTGVKPYFNAYVRMTNNLYYDLEKSIEIANKLLYYQFNNDGNQIKSFLTVLYNIIDKKIPKLNSLCIYSEPSAGKNFFFDAVASFF